MLEKSCVVFCDDIRQELGNKLSLMGVYSDVVNVVQELDMLPKLCIFARLELQGGQSHKFALRAEYGENKYEFTDVDLDLREKNGNGVTAFAFVMSPFPIAKGGPISVFFVPESKESEKIGEIMIVRVETIDLEK